MAKGGGSSDKLKYSEWRPIGVCDKAPPGVQKAQMFSREDFLVITAPDVNRENWRSRPEVTSILQRYCSMLAKQSTTTTGMKKPVVSNIKLVGAIMKLAVTPDLNKESEDGKLQLFQVEFEDKGVKKKRKLLPAILVILLILLLILSIILGFAIYDRLQTKQATSRRFRSTGSYTIHYCNDSENIAGYTRDLENANRILQREVTDLYNQGKIMLKRQCDGASSSLSIKESQFLECYSLIWQHDALSTIPRADLMKVNACRKKICRKGQNPQSAVCRGR